MGAALATQRGYGDTPDNAMLSLACTLRACDVPVSACGWYEFHIDNVARPALRVKYSGWYEVKFSKFRGTSNECTAIVARLYAGSRIDVHTAYARPGRVYSFEQHRWVSHQLDDEFDI